MIVNVVLVLYFFFMAPFMLWDRIRGKRHPAFLQRMGFDLPTPDRAVIWIHGVSVGEIKAAGPLFKALRSDSAYFFITTTTATGFAEAARTLPEADAIAYLPIDFTWVVRRFVKALNPTHFILVESDFWPNLLRELKKSGTKISLVSGKISEKSARRFAFFSYFSKRLFACFDHLCVQSEEYYQRFLPFSDPARLAITGNLKFDIQAGPLTRKLELTKPVITISCTHAPEEELILNALIGGPWTLILAPRHPERFDEVAQLLEKKNLPYSRWSKHPSGRLILVDAMGQLPICYRESDLAILGGSFVEGIGGHNVLEPCLYGVPVFFGPFMQTQQEFVKRVLETKAGYQLPIVDLRQAVDQFFQAAAWADSMRRGTKDAVEVGRGATLRTVAVLQR